ncbi:MAG: N-glycosylase/DNA lyase [Candidatus Woesearchaeota archaeon]
MKKLVDLINKQKKKKIRNVIDGKIKDFSDLGRNLIRNLSRNLDDETIKDDIFKELCFCILTANFQAGKSIIIQKEIGDGFLTLTEKQLAAELRKLGHRFPNMRAKYIVEARKHKNDLIDMLNSKKTDQEKREWIVNNIKGLGMKESSHFLRNIGHQNLAILDFHIINLLVEHGIVERQYKNKQSNKPKSLTKKKYSDIENKLSLLCEKTDLTQSEMDLYLWYLETGKVLK